VKSNECRRLKTYGRTRWLPGLLNRAAALGYRHAACSLAMCGLRTRPRTDVDPPRVELPSAGGISSRRPRGDNLYSDLLWTGLFSRLRDKWAGLQGGYRVAGLSQNVRGRRRLLRHPTCRPTTEYQLHRAHISRAIIYL